MASLATEGFYGLSALNHGSLKKREKSSYFLGGTQSVWALSKTPCLQCCAYIDQPENYFLQTLSLFW